MNRELRAMGSSPWKIWFPKRTVRFGRLAPFLAEMAPIVNSSQCTTSGMFIFFIPPPGNHPYPGIKPASPALAGGFFINCPTWEGSISPLGAYLYQRLPGVPSRPFLSAEFNLSGHDFFFKIFFLMWTIFKVCIEFATILLSIYVLFFWPQGTQDLSSPTRDGTQGLCSGSWSLNHWATREVPWVWLSVAFFFVSDRHLPVYKMSSGVSGVKFNSPSNSQISGVLWNQKAFFFISSWKGSSDTNCT